MLKTHVYVFDGVERIHILLNSICFQFPFTTAIYLNTCKYKYLCESNFQFLTMCFKYVGFFPIRKSPSPRSEKSVLYGVKPQRPLLLELLLLIVMARHL